MNKLDIKKYLFCAIDFKTITESEKILSVIKNHIGGIKLGLEFFIANGLEGVKYLQKLQLPIFLDLKLHDIPNTVNEALNAALKVKPEYISVHINGGRSMLDLIMRNKRINSTKIIGITMLTSLDKDDLYDLCINLSPKNYVKKLAKLAFDSGLNGIVCSPMEVKSMKKMFPKNFTLITPGIRLKSQNINNDQKRILSPGEAVSLGSDILIVGRPITQSKNPLHTINEITEDIKKKGNYAHKN